MARRGAARRSAVQSSPASRAPTCSVGSHDGHAAAHVDADVHVLHAKVVAARVLEAVGATGRQAGQGRWDGLKSEEAR